MPKRISSWLIIVFTGIFLCIAGKFTSEYLQTIKYISIRYQLFLVGSFIFLCIVLGVMVILVIRNEGQHYR